MKVTNKELENLSAKKAKKLVKYQKESELKKGEYHPSANSALIWYKVWASNLVRYVVIRESLASTALAGNRLAQICLGTMDRLEHGEPVSDRYLLGLCWFLKNDMEKYKKK